LSLLKHEGLPSYKPFKYQMAYDIYKIHEKMHWLPEDIELSSDVRDWNTKLTKGDKELITYILRLFTQSDVMVGFGYARLLNIFKPTEIRMLHASILSREAIHQDAYSLFTDTMGFEESFYEEFKSYEEMASKMEYIDRAKVKQFHKYLELTKGDHKEADKLFRYDLAKHLGIYGGLTEGVVLFASFAILMNYSRQGMMNGLSLITEYSIKEEEVHCQANSWLFKELIKEDRSIWNDALKKDLYDSAREMVALEEKFIELAFSNYEIKGLTKTEVIEYVHYIADRRLLELGLKANFGVKKNPLPWMETIINSATFGNFFDTKVIEYTKGATQGDWGEVRANLSKYVNH